MPVFCEKFHSSLIADGTKTWELRSHSQTLRGGDDHGKRVVDMAAGDTFIFAEEQRDGRTLRLVCRVSGPPVSYSSRGHACR